MDKKEILRNATVIPIIFGIILAIALCFYLNANIEGVLPVPRNTTFAYHDSAIVDASAKVDWENLKSNDSIGELEIGETKLALCYEADYSNLIGSVSVAKESAALNNIGCAYLKTTMANAKLFENAKKISIDSEYGSFKYELIDKLEFKNEYQAKIYAPSAPKSLVVYYQASNGVGLTSKYNALVFKEV